MDIRLDGRIALVTGATGGIGSAIATEFFKSGATVVINGRTQEKIDALTDKLLSGGDKKDAMRIAGIAMDLTALDSGENMVRYTTTKFDKLDILVNNAAIIGERALMRCDEEYINRIISVNLTKQMLLTIAALKPMCKNRYGRIINITSISGQCGEAGLATYAASKAGLHGFTKSVADEYGKRNITANSIAPGIVETKSAMQTISDEYKQSAKKLIPNHRFAKPSEIADLVTFLASERAAYINGQQIAINGGLYR